MELGVILDRCHPNPMFHTYLKPKFIAFIACAHVHVERAFKKNCHSRLGHVTFSLCVHHKHSCHFPSGSLVHNQNIVFLRSPLVSWHVKMCTIVFELQMINKWSQIFSPECDMSVNLLWQNSWLCLQFLCNKCGKKHSGLFKRLMDWLSMIV